ncbi:MAG TPA: type VI secretion system tube protein Hcp [Marmoricola sp.]|nr:type VI secretion system tube protein Hcp [Marmoricola sp.]
MLKTKRARWSAFAATAVVASTASVAAFSSQAGAAPSPLGARASAVIGGTCTGQHQGAISSDQTVAGHKGTWSISRLTDGIVTPIDTSTGMVTGRNQEQGVKITMAASPATIGLINAETTNENLTTCTFTFYRPAATGALQGYLQIKLTNAHVISYALNGTPASASTTYAFVAQRITRTWLIGNKTAVDDWNQPT